MKLNLGCGKKPLLGWINVDKYIPSDPMDEFQFLAHDLRIPLPYKDGSITDIYAKHLIEHFSADEWACVLGDWHRVLEVGGTVAIECPDILKVCEAFSADTHGMRYTWWHHCIYGSDATGGPHKQGFTIPKLRDHLSRAGFQITRARNWGDDCNDWANYNMRMEAVKL